MWKMLSKKNLPQHVLISNISAPLLSVKVYIWGKQRGFYQFNYVSGHYQLVTSRLQTALSVILSA